MCVALAAVGLTAWQTAALGISAATTAASFYAASQQSKAVEASSKASAELQSGQLTEAERETNEQASEAMSERARAAMIERGRLKAIFAESGMQGNTETRILGESYFNEGQDIASLEADRSKRIQQFQMDKRGVLAQDASRRAAAPRPSALTAGLQITGATLNQASISAERNRIAAIDV